MENREIEEVYKAYYPKDEMCVFTTHTASKICKDILDQQNKSLLEEIEMLKFQLKAADSVNEQLQFQYNELEKAMYKLTISNDNN